MKIAIEGADQEFAEKLVVLAAEHRAELTVTTVDTGWSVDRAETYLTSLAGAARHFAQHVIYADGMADADDLRPIFGSLCEPRIALSRAVTRGLREGWWPQGTPEPITPVYDPDNPSRQKAIAYQMTGENVLIFRAALDRLLPHAQQAGDLGLPPGGLGRTRATFVLGPDGQIDASRRWTPAPADDQEAVSVPRTPEEVADAMDAWEAANGTTDLYDELVAHLGTVTADNLWDAACRLYDLRPAAPLDDHEEAHAGCIEPHHSADGYVDCDGRPL
ncbi:hypothetical protein [Streptomyces sp. WM6378]|uniref:hypothetical protein n=1 Tax=Streptomyces sp. WM6378 TaxID=1415557 RepID=UPI0007C7C415|nr:hypothetical protein [Streptomyces sp. WM6378]